MKISTENPPKNIRGLCEFHFDLKGVKPVFTYGDTIYNPHGGFVDAGLEAHELVHAIRQGEDPEAWWVQYFKDPKFRFDEELKAYRVQYGYMHNFIKDRNELARFLMRIAGDLSGTMYGSMCSQSEAMKLIKQK